MRVGAIVILAATAAGVYLIMIYNDRVRAGAFALLQQPVAASPACSLKLTDVMASFA